jgi:hypothetical protein
MSSLHLACAPFYALDYTFFLLDRLFPRSTVHFFTWAAHFRFIELVCVLAPKICDLRDGLLIARSNMFSLAPQNLACTKGVSHMRNFGSSFEQLGHRVQRFGANLTLKSLRSDNMSLT